MKEMVTEAIVELRERGGSSLSKIKKYCVENFDLDLSSGSDKSRLNKALSHGTSSGLYIKNKGSYKVAAKGGATRKKKARCERGGRCAPRRLLPE